MNKEKWESIAKLAGLKLNQKFKIDEYGFTDNMYKVTEDGIFWAYKEGSCWCQSTELSIEKLLSSENIRIIAESISYENWFPKFGETYYYVEITDIWGFNDGFHMPKGVIGNSIKNMGKEEKRLKEMKKLRLIFPTVKEAEARYKEIMEKIK